MDSRLIYKTSQHLQSQVSWEKVSESEWIYCGTLGEVKYDIVESHLNIFFKTEKAYVSITRKDSFDINKATLFESIKDIIGSKDFFIWNEDFKKVIEFSKIGVFRKGLSAFNIVLQR
jgi:hypothetical protein